MYVSKYHQSLTTPLLLSATSIHNSQDDNDNKNDLQDSSTPAVAVAKTKIYSVGRRRQQLRRPHLDNCANIFDDNDGVLIVLIVRASAALSYVIVDDVDNVQDDDNDCSLAIKMVRWRIISGPTSITSRPPSPTKTTWRRQTKTTRKRNAREFVDDSKTTTY